MEDEANRPAIIQEAKTVLLASTPAATQELKFWILQTLGRYREFNGHDERMKASIISDWMETFGDYPLDVLERMRKAWREGPRATYMPQEGDLIAVTSERDAQRVYLRDAAKRISEQTWF